MSEEKKYTSTATWGGMVAFDQRLTVYCTPCGRSVEIDMTKLPPDGNAIGRTFRCSQCGEKGRCIVSPKSNDQNIARGISNDFIGPVQKRVVYDKRRRRR